MPHRLDGEAGLQVVEAGAAHIEGAAADADVQLVAIGAYQLEEALKAARRLAGAGVRPLVTVLIEPGRFRATRDPIERSFTASDAELEVRTVERRVGEGGGGTCRSRWSRSN